jgi:lysophospholipase L1-like esterase
MAHINKLIALGAVLLNFLLFTQCKTKDDKPMDTPDTKLVKYLALGDSYTKGESVPKEQSFPYLLKDSIEKRGTVKIEKLQVIAQTGWTTAHLLAAINNEKITETFDLVTLLIGVNNQYRDVPIDIYEKEFLILINKAIAFAGGNKNNVAVISIPDYGATPFGADDAENIGKEIDGYNSINKRISDSLQISYFDITPISRQASADPSLTAFDDLHPSGKMYALWVQLMQKDILKKVE